MFRPPVNRAMRVLDRSFFKKHIPLSAARVYDPRTISKIRTQLEKSKDILDQRMILPIRLEPHPEVAGRKCILLRPEIRHDDQSTWSAAVRELQGSGVVGLMPFDVHLDYEYWQAQDILAAIIPEDLHDDLPHRFAPAGHIAHFNLRDRYLPYKHLIGQIIIDKNPNITTVVNKTENLGDDNQFRVLNFELLAGDPSYNVTLREHGIRYAFDFSRVFWNTRLETEHKHLVSHFVRPGQAVCDVMAGVGPFAIPAALKGVFVFANDLNPACVDGLRKSLVLNKVGDGFVQVDMQDGNDFIRDATAELLARPPVVSAPAHYDPRRSRYNQSGKAQSPSTNPKLTNTYKRSPSPGPGPRPNLKAPRTFSHYIMNLPATAIDFLASFRGIYSGHEHLFEPHTTTKLPLVHCYCFGRKVDPEAGWTREQVEEDVLGRVREALFKGLEIDGGAGAGAGATGKLKAVRGALDDGVPFRDRGANKDKKKTSDTDMERELEEGECEIRDVRDVAPNKQEICCSIRLPREVAFARTSVSR